MSLQPPRIMGILNVTPDSFYESSRSNNEILISDRVKAMIEEGVDIIDIGGCSTRPGYEAPSPEEEWARIDLGCKIVREIWPDAPISVDTFRSIVAQKAIETWNVAIINDISGGSDPLMWETVAKTGVAYVLTDNSQEKEREFQDVTAEIITDLSKKVNELHRLGVNDIIIDPGFGFSKTLDENFILLEALEEIVRMGYPVLVGISRKSMIYKWLDKTAEEALGGTIALDAIALEKGADILRVHDVREAVETVKLFSKLKRLSV